MTVSDLVSAVKQYELTLTALEAAATTHPSPQQVIDVLMARDEVYAVRTAKTQTDKESLMMVISLDERLKKQSELITKLVKLADWRAIVHPPVEAWWWFLEPPTNQWDKFDWLWSAGSVTLLTASLSLVVDISSRFLTGVPDTLGAFTITTQSVLTLLAAGGALTKTGQEAIERLLISLNIPKHFQNEVKFGFTLLLFLCLFSIRFYLPKIAIFYYNQGEKDYKANRLASAQSNYNRAIKLNPDDLKTHHRLGQLYERLQDFDRARAEYQIAVQGDFGKGYNNLARLYILDKKYPAAIALLKEAQLRTKDNQDKELQYGLLKNLGWALLEQKRYVDAENNLQEAINLTSDRAPAYCLMAQIRERQNDKKKAVLEWEKCLAYAFEYNPDEDAWISMAQQCLKVKQCLETKKGDD
ncbi:MAG: tetratricopeptide repeat protein [Nostoc sp.]|uniref:tetratricopeptide repeat protein n=1 Tax=Nostoc sp. TaxID=1180 RepID=UPI002FF7B03B